MPNSNAEKELLQPERQIQNSPELERYYAWLRNLRLVHRDFNPQVPDSIPKSSEFIDKDLLWKQYQMSIDLYKQYLDLVIKFNVFYYAITGAFLSYYFSHLSSDLVRWSLVFPMIMSMFSAWTSYRAARSIPRVAEPRRRLAAVFRAAAIRHRRAPTRCAPSRLGSALPKCFHGVFKPSWGIQSIEAEHGQVEARPRRREAAVL